jgi:ABC-type transport system involved in multi-copper enzyme maturation permease subunit
MIPNRLKVIFEVIKKEMYEHFKTKRLIIISLIYAIVFFIVMFVGHYLIGGDVPVYKRGANEALGVLLAFSSLFPPILAIALSYDTIVGERTRKSLHLVLSKPVDRTSIYLGKFLAAFLSISLVYLSVSTLGYLVVVGASGKIPASIEVGRAYAAIGILLLSAACWILFVMLFSTSFKTVTSTLIFSVLFWLFIMNLASNMGLIYFYMSQDSEDILTVDILNVGEQGGSDSTNIMFLAQSYGVPDLGIEYELYDESENLIKPMETGDFLSITPLSFYQIGPGNYTWKAMKMNTETDSFETIRSGSFYFGSGFSPFIQLTSFNNDSLYDDVLLLVGDVTFEKNAGYDLTVRSVEDNNYVVTETDYSGPYFITNLSEGDYEVEISKNGTSLFKNTIHSFGDTEGGGGFIVINEDEELEFPDYVKITFAMNPDNAAIVSYTVLEGGDTSLGILTLEEGLAALCIEAFILLLMGLFIFSKIELL